MSIRMTMQNRLFCGNTLLDTDGEERVPATVGAKATFGRD